MKKQQAFRYTLLRNLIQLEKSGYINWQKLDLNIINSSRIHSVYTGIVKSIKIIDNIINDYLRKKGLSLSQRVLLRIGVYELIYTDEREYVIISEIVKIADKHKYNVRFINGILKNISNNKSNIIEKYIETEYNCNNYIGNDLFKLLRQKYSVNELNSFLNNIDIQNSYYCTVNIKKIEFESFLKKIDVIDIDYEKTGFENVIKINSGIGSLLNNSEFYDGYYYIQDIFAHILTQIIKPRNDDVILDYCAAPGGKTISIKNIKTDVQMYLYEIDSVRRDLLNKNFSSYKYNNIKIVDKDEIPYDKINKVIIDAPCSGSGLIIRHPETRWKKYNLFLKNIIEEQNQILSDIISKVRSGTEIYYSICSILPQEGEFNIGQFIKNNNKVELQNVSIDKNKIGNYFVKTKTGVTVFPNDYNNEGFFIAKLKTVK